MARVGDPELEAAYYAACAEANALIYAKRRGPEETIDQDEAAWDAADTRRREAWEAWRATWESTAVAACAGPLAVAGRQ